MPDQMRVSLLMLAAGCGIALNFTLLEIGVSCPRARRAQTAWLVPVPQGHRSRSFDPSEPDNLGYYERFGFNMTVESTQL